MKTLLMSAAALLACASMALADDLLGDWRTAPDDNGNTGTIRIVQCQTSYCGTLIEAFDAAGVTMESENVGRQIIWDTNPTGETGEYRGMLYSPDRDRDYRARLQLSDSGLAVSGCVLGGVLCREGGVWQRAD